MPLHFVGDSRDDFPEALKPHVKDIGSGKFAVVEGTAGHRATDDTALRNALAREREKVQTWKDAGRSYGLGMSDDGTLLRGADSFDPMTAREAIAFKATNGKIDQDVDARLRERTQALEAKFKQDREALELERKDLHEFAFTQFVQREAEAAIKAAGGTDDTIKLLWPTIKLRAKVTQHGKEFGAVALDANGREMISKRAGSAEPMGIAELVASMKSDRTYAAAFPAKPTGGSGGDHSTAGGSVQGGGDNTNAGMLSARQMLEAAFP